MPFKTYRKAIKNLILHIENSEKEFYEILENKILKKNSKKVKQLLYQRKVLIKQLLAVLKKLEKKKKRLSAVKKWILKKWLR